MDTDDYPTISRDQMRRGTIKKAGEVVRRGVGRPAGSDNELVSMRLNKAMIERWRATGPGWQTRFNAAMQKVEPA